MHEMQGGEGKMIDEQGFSPAPKVKNEEKRDYLDEKHRFKPGNPGKPKGAIHGPKKIIIDAFLGELQKNAQDPKWLKSMLRSKYGKAIVLKAIANGVFGKDVKVSVKNYNVNRVETNGSSPDGTDKRRELIDRIQGALSEND